MAKRLLRTTALQFISTAEEEQEQPRRKRRPRRKLQRAFNPLYVETKTRRTACTQPSLFNRVKKGAKQAGLSVNESVHRILDEATKGEE